MLGEGWVRLVLVCGRNLQLAPNVLPGGGGGGGVVGRRGVLLLLLLLLLQHVDRLLLLLQQHEVGTEHLHAVI